MWKALNVTDGALEEIAVADSGVPQADREPGSKRPPLLLLLAAVLAFAIALLATSALASPAPSSPMFMFCDGHITEIQDVRPCPDGSLIIVR